MVSSVTSSRPLPAPRPALSPKAVLEKVLRYKGDLPLDPRTGDPVAGPYKQPAVFFAPHPDDESIGMAGSIAQAVKAGKDVYLEVLTHGEGSKAGFALLLRGQWVFGDALGKARVAEVLDAARRLGVKGIHVSDFGDGNVTKQEVNGRVRFWEKRAAGPLTLRGTVGEGDPTLGKRTPHPDHQACWEAVSESSAKDAAGFYIYRYQTGKGSPDQTVDVSGERAKKLDALEAYRVWDPGHGRYAVGEHSVGELISKATKDVHEYIERPHRQ